MKITAQQVRDAGGYLSVVSGLHLADLRAHSLGETKKDPFSVHVPLKFKGRLVQLLDNERFNLLVSRLINVEGYQGEEIVRAGSVSGMRVICVAQKEFRERGGLIFVK